MQMQPDKFFQRIPDDLPRDKTIFSGHLFQYFPEEPGHRPGGPDLPASFLPGKGCEVHPEQFPEIIRNDPSYRRIIQMFQQERDKRSKIIIRSLFQIDLFLDLLSGQPVSDLQGRGQRLRQITVQPGPHQKQAQRSTAAMIPQEISHGNHFPPDLLSVPIPCIGPCPQDKGDPLFMSIKGLRRPREIILHVQGSGKEKRLTDPLIFSFEAALHTNRTQPRRPATGGYLMPGAAAGMIHIQMEFDDGMICLIRHELSDKGPSARCRFSGGKATATADLEKGTLRVRTQESEDHIPAEKLFPGHTFSPLYHSWQRFLRQPAEPLPALEERITATRLAKYTTEKIHNRILTPAAPEKTW